MKVLSLTLLCSLFCSPLVLAEDDDVAVAARILIQNPNGPNEETPTCKCKKGELQAAIDGQLNNRMLRKQQDRQLNCFPQCPKWCYKGDVVLCAQFCYSCKKRRLDETVPSQEEEQGYRIVDDHSRNLGVSLHERCQTMEQQLGDTVTAIVDDLSPACKCIVEKYIHMQGAVTFNCAVHIENDELAGFKLWTEDSGDYAVTDANFGSVGSATVCASQSFNIEAVAGALVKRVEFSIAGPDGYEYDRTERKAAFMAFGNNGSKMFEDNITTAGVYTLTAKPDWDSSKELTLSFEVQVC